MDAFIVLFINSTALYFGFCLISSLSCGHLASTLLCTCSGEWLPLVDAAGSTVAFHFYRCPPEIVAKRIEVSNVTHLSSKFKSSLK